MAEEAGKPERTINIQVTANNASESEVKELVDGITAKVVDAAQSWQERLKERAAKSAQPALPSCP